MAVKYLVAEVDEQAETGILHYVVDDRMHASGLASHGRICYAPVSELDRKDDLLRDLAKAVRTGELSEVVSAIEAAEREIGA